MKNTHYLLLSCLTLLAACKGSGVIVIDDDWYPADTASVEEPPAAYPYQESYTREFDLVDTKLWVSFDWQKERLNGKALLRLTPYFYPSSTLVLDAKGFDIHSIKEVNEANRELRYSYPDSFKLNIPLDRKYTRNDTLDILIDYTAKPNELPTPEAFVTIGSIGGGRDKGLYFINADESDPTKPRQLWTQGETEASSCWFPTIDAPNERTTQEMFITIEQDFTTISNGILKDKKDNGDGTRTDHWVMSQPHAPYLFMMAAGPFAKVEDKWRSMPVDYYVDSAYAPFAKDVFGHTPEMIEYFSTVLGVDYVWPKYSQVVVHEFVSGAMENTSATIHYDALHKTDRELLDAPMDDIISHELFHQWFGDLVTCESWSNIALNESFATYGEYLWNEYKYGRDEADYYGQIDADRYMSEASYKQEPLIRFHYDHRDDLFDRHSYQKGGRILHMLRKVVGDEAFFASLKRYLETNAYTAVEAHDLRLAFEEVTGQDLNWFFDQWFFSPGHPVITIDYEYNESEDLTYVTIWQEPSSDSGIYFDLPICVDVYEGDGIRRLDQTISGPYTVLTVPHHPDLINVDANKMLLCAKTDNKTAEQFNFQYYHAPLYLDRAEAVEACGTNQWAITESRDVLFDALSDPFWGLRAMAIENLSNIDDIKASYVAKLKLMAKDDPNSGVRAAALSALSGLLSVGDNAFLISALGDSSYMVVGEALSALYTIDSAEAYRQSKQFWGESNHQVATMVSAIIATHGQADAAEYYHTVIPKMDWWSQYSVIGDYGKLMSRLSDAAVMSGCEFLFEHAQANDSWMVTLKVQGVIDERIAAYQSELDSKPKAEREAEVTRMIERLQMMRKELDEE